MSSPLEAPLTDIGKLMLTLLKEVRIQPQQAHASALKFESALNEHIQQRCIRIIGFTADQSSTIVNTVLRHANSGSVLDSTPFAPEPGIETALARGHLFKQETWAGPGMLASEEAAQRINISRETLNTHRKANRALGLEVPSKRGVRYPDWQFEDRVLPEMPAVLDALKWLDPWSQYLFLTQPEPLLAGGTPLAALRNGKCAEVVDVANRLAEAG